MGFFIFATLVAAMARLSCVGFGVLIALILIPIGTAMQIVVLKAINRQWNKLSVVAKLLPVLMGLLYMAAFFFQEDGGDDMGGYAIYMFLNTGHHYFNGIENVAEIATWAYLVCFYLFLFLAYYKQGEKKLFKKVALGFLLPVTPLIFLYVSYYIDKYKTEREYYRDYETVEIPYDEDDYEYVRKFKLYRYPNQYTYIPDTVFKFSNLEQLNFSQQEVTAIPKEIARLQNLVVIDGSSNKITKIPNEIGQLKNLEALFLMGNYIDSIPESICSCINLKNLRVGGPALVYIPDCIKDKLQLDFFQIESDSLFKQKDNFQQRFKGIDRVILRPYSY